MNFDEELDDEVIFWREYEKKENSTYPADWRWILTYVPKMIMPRDERKPPTEEEKARLNYCVNESRFYCLKLFAINSIFLIVFNVIVALSDVEMIGEVNSLKYTVIIQQINIWLFFSLFGFFYFLILHFAPHLFREYFNVCKYDVWMNYCLTINVTFLLIIVVKLSRYGYMYRGLCYEQIDLNIAHDSTYTFVFLELFIDTLQTVVFTTIPYPSPMAIYLILIKLVGQMVLFRSCVSQMMKQDNLEWFVEIVYLSAINIYLILIVSSANLIRSLESSFEITQLQTQYIKQKNKLIQFLSPGAKYPLLCTLLSGDNVMENIDIDPAMTADISARSTSNCNGNTTNSFLRSKSPPVEVSDKAKESFKLLTTAKDLMTSNAIKINNLTDDLLLLAKLQEMSTLPKDRLQFTSVRDLFQSIMDASPHPEVLTHIKMTIPYCAIVVDREILGVLFRHFLQFASGHLACHARRTDSVSSYQPKLSVTSSLCIILEENPLYHPPESSWIFGEKKSSVGKYILRVVVECRNDHTAIESVQYGMYVRKSLLLCKKLMRYIKGTIAVESDHSRFELSMECNQQDHEATTITHDDEVRDVKYQVGIVMLDSVVEGQLRNVLIDCADVESPKSFLSINEFLNSNLKINFLQIIFVDSIINCKILKDVGYVGLIIYVTCARTYIANTSPYYDYVFPLPCFLVDSKELIIWLESVSVSELLKKRQREINPAPSSFPDDLLDRPILPVVEPRVTSIKWSTWLFQAVTGWFRWWFIETELGMIHIPLKEFETYTKWRLLNPTHSIFHHTNWISIRFIIYLFHNAVHIILRGGSLEFGGFQSVLVVTVIIMFRHYIYRYILQANKHGLYGFWLIISLTYVIVNVLGFAVLVSQGKCSGSECRSVFSITASGSALVDARIGSVYTGKALIDFIANGSGIFVGWLIHFTWPMRMIYITFSAIRALLIVSYVAKLFLSRLLFTCILILYLLLLIITVCVEFHSEYLYRQEYMLLRKQILKSHLIDWSLSLCEEELLVQVKDFDNARNQFLSQINRKVLCNEIIINEDLLRFLSPMHYSGLKLQELVNMLEFRSSKRGDESVGSVGSNVNFMRNVLIMKDFVNHILDKFKDTTDMLGIKLFIDLESTLTVIRTNRALLITLIVNGVSNAIVNILKTRKRDELKYAQTNDHNKKDVYKCSTSDTQQEIVVILKPMRPALDDHSHQPMPKFIDTRLMIVNVLDTSTSVYLEDQPPQSGPLDPEEVHLDDLELLSNYYNTNISLDWCTSMVEVCGEKYFVEASPLKHAHYGAYYRFTVPYKLSKESKKASEYNHIDTAKRVTTNTYVMQPVDRNINILLDMYHGQLQGMTNSKNRDDASSSSTNEKTESKRIPRKSILLYVSRNNESIKEYSRYAALFELNGWKTCKYNEAQHKDDVIEFGEDTMDAILIDSKINDFLFNAILKARIKYGPALVVAVLYDNDAEIAKNAVFLTDITNVNVTLVKPISPEKVINACNVSIVNQLLLLLK